MPKTVINYFLIALHYAGILLVELLINISPSILEFAERQRYMFVHSISFPILPILNQLPFE